jgi:hypothetical protein
MKHLKKNEHGAAALFYSPVFFNLNGLFVSTEAEQN